MATNKKIRGSTASYNTPNGPKCDIEELAKTYKDWGNVPLSINDTKAGEIALLARSYLHLLGVRKVLEHQVTKLEKKNGRK